MEHLREAWCYTERNACRLVQSRSTQRDEARIDYEERRIRKWVQRLWREEGLRNPLRKRRKRARGHSENSCAIKKAEYKNPVWCWDFTMEGTADGRGLKWFSVLDELTRECLALEVERRMTARDVVAILTWLKAKHRTSGAVRSDNGPEFIARAVKRWLAARKVGPVYIAPGSP